MSNFMVFKNAVKEQFNKMSKNDLFVIDVNKDELWNLYLDSFPSGTNNIYKERREYDCQCCKQFIKLVGGVVSIVDNKLISIWDIKTKNSTFNIVAKVLSKYVKSKSIKDVFLHYEDHAGTDFNHQQIEDEIIKWEHFYCDIPNIFVKRKDNIGSLLSDFRSTKEVFKRGLDEITVDAIETVLELIEQNSIYRGSEFKSIVESFFKFKKDYSKLSLKDRDNFCWNNIKDKVTSRIRNTSIGTLLIDLSNNININDAVKNFESKVAPENYKRPTALITKSMISNAQKTVQELGIEDSLYRRFAIKDDIDLNDILFADRNIKKPESIFEELQEEIPDNIKNFDKIEEVTSEKFIDGILPKAETIEVLFENKHINNLVSLIAPKIEGSRGIFKWDNNFSWTYNNNVTDSLRNRVQALGGRVDGVFRFSHSWNEIEPNQSLMDLHVFMPGNSHTKTKVCDNYGNNNRVGWNRRKEPCSGGVQDVDYVNQAPKGYIPVENITFPHLSRMPEGKYICKIHNWNFRETGGRGRAEIEFNGNVYRYIYPQTKHKEWVTVAEVTLKDGKFSIKHCLPESNESKEEWGILTNKFHKVNMIMNSPNHWIGNNIGNKHLLFMIDSCINKEATRGFFNEYLKEELKEHRKVFEVLGNKMNVAPTMEQLSGLGYSSTRKDVVVVRVKGKFNRVLKVKF